MFAAKIKVLLSTIYHPLYTGWDGFAAGGWLFVNFQCIHFI